MSTPHTITVTHTLTPEFLQDIMTTAVESSYEWFNFDHVERIKGGDRHLSVTAFDALEVDCDGDGAILSTTAINAEKIVAAMTKIIADGLVPQYHRDTIACACAASDASDIDMDLADCILQVACFDELRYG